MANKPKPRSSGWGTRPVYAKHTWLEPEELAYSPKGSQIRRCFAICPDGIARVIMCGIPDTFFSIPAHATIKGKYTRGWVGSDNDGEFVYHITG